MTALSTANNRNSIDAVDRRDFAGIRVALATLETASNHIVSLSKQSEVGHDIHLVNAYTIALTHTNETYRNCIRASHLNFADGKPISLFTKFSKEPVGHVRGPSLFGETLGRGIEERVRHFFLGGNDVTLQRIIERARLDNPEIIIAGSFSPPFRELTAQERKAQDEMLRNCRPDIIWVGLGTPKQDFEAQRLAGLGFTAVAVGAAFDFYAGTKREAPAWITTLGLEWVFRFANEPRRLWRRYLVGNITFIWACLAPRK